MQLIFLGENVHCKGVHFQAEQRIFDKEEEEFIVRVRFTIFVMYN